MLKIQKSIWKVLIDNKKFKLIKILTMVTFQLKKIIINRDDNNSLSYSLDAMDVVRKVVKNVKVKLAYKKNCTISSAL